MILILSQYDDCSTINVIKRLIFFNIPFIRINRENLFAVKQF